MNYSDKFFYTNEHVWLNHIIDNKYQVGITHFAQDLLGDIVFIDIKSNEPIFKNRPMGVIESVKTASDFISPADGSISAINQVVIKSPELINEKPHDMWICEILINKEFDKSSFLSCAEYLELIKN
mgnify:CR=1 FL=1